MLRHLSHNAHNTRAADDTHAFGHTVVFAPINGQRVVQAAYTPPDYFGRNQITPAQTVRHHAFGLRAVMTQAGQGCPKIGNLLLHDHVAFGQFPVGFRQVSIAQQFPLHALHTSHHGIGLRKEHAALIVIAAHDQRQTHSFQQEEYKPMDFPDKKGD